jgi:hypothetical protein
MITESLLRSLRVQLRGLLPNVGVFGASAQTSCAAVTVCDFISTIPEVTSFGSASFTIYTGGNAMSIASSRVLLAAETPSLFERS